MNHYFQICEELFPLPWKTKAVILHYNLAFTTLILVHYINTVPVNFSMSLLYRKYVETVLLVYFNPRYVILIVNVWIPGFRILQNVLPLPTKKCQVPHNHNHNHRLLDKPSICIQFCAAKLKYLFTDVYINPLFAPSTKLPHAIQM